jgi:hypothetical protein
VKLTPTLYQARPSKSYIVYISRCAPENKVICGIKGEESGYVFAPFMFGVDHRYNQPYALARYGKKLLRGGAKYFGTIEVK